MVIGDALATCLGCGGDVPPIDLAAVLAQPDGSIHIAWTHRACGHSQNRFVSRETAVAIGRRIAGVACVSPEEQLMAQWHLELDTEFLTVSLFQQMWDYGKKEFGRP